MHTRTHTHILKDTILYIYVWTIYIYIYIYVSLSLSLSTYIYILIIKYRYIIHRSLLYILWTYTHTHTHTRNCSYVLPKTCAVYFSLAYLFFMIFSLLFHGVYFAFRARLVVKHIWLLQPGRPQLSPVLLRGSLPGLRPLAC